MLRAVFFDANGTLIEVRTSVGELYARTAAEHGVQLPAWRLDEAFQRVVARADSMFFPGLSPPEVREREREWWRAIVRSTFLAADSTVRFRDFEAFFAALFALFAGRRAWRTRPEGLALARLAHRRGLRTGVLSNFDHRLPILLEELEIVDLFEIIRTPSTSGAAKPEPRAFELAAEALGLAPRDCAYVGHDPALDLEPARAAGFAAIDVGDRDAAATLAALCK